MGFNGFEMVKSYGMTQSLLTQRSKGRTEDITCSTQGGGVLVIIY